MRSKDKWIKIAEEIEFVFVSPRGMHLIDMEATCKNIAVALIVAYDEGYDKGHDDGYEAHANEGEW